MTDISLSLPKTRNGTVMCMHKGHVQNKFQRVVLHVAGAGPMGQLARGSTA